MVFSYTVVVNVEQAEEFRLVMVGLSLALYTDLSLHQAVEVDLSLMLYMVSLKQPQEMDWSLVLYVDVNVEEAEEF